MNAEEVKMELSKLPKFEGIEWNIDEATIRLMRALDKWGESFAQDFKEFVQKMEE